MRKNIYVFSNKEKITTGQSFKKIKSKNFKIFFYDYKKEIKFKKNDYIFHIDPCNFLNFNILKNKNKKAVYLIDTHRDFNSRKKISYLFDYIFVAQYDDYLKLKKLNKNTYWLPLGYDSNINTKTITKKIYDVGFVGKINDFDKKSKDRKKIISTVLDKFNHNKQKYYTTSQCYDIYKKSKLVINKSIDNDLNMRIFEAMGNGSVLVTNKITNKMNTLFKKNFHYLEYQNLKECLQIIKIHLRPSMQKKMNKISTNAQKIILQKHTYQKRLEKVFDIMLSKKKYDQKNIKLKISSEIYFNYHYSNLEFFKKNFLNINYFQKEFYIFFLLTVCKHIYRKYV